MKSIQESDSILSSQGGIHHLIQFSNGKVSFWQDGKRSRITLNNPTEGGQEINFRKDITHMNYFSKTAGNGWIALGLRNGGIILYSLQTNEQMNLSSTEKHAITALCVEDQSLFSADEAGNIFHYVVFGKGGVDIVGKKEVAKPTLIKSGLGSITAMNVFKDEKGEVVIAAAVKTGVQVSLFGLDGRKLGKYKNFSFPPIVNLNILYGKVVLAAENQRNISVIYDNENVLNLVALAKPKIIKINYNRPTRNAFHILCVDENGVLNVWTISRKKKISTSKKAVCQVRIKNQAILNATFESEDRILLVYGKAINPQFHSVTYIQEDKIIEKINLDLEEETGLLVKPEKKKRSSRKSLTVLGSSESTLPSINMVGVQGKKHEDELIAFGNLIERAEGLKTDQPKVESMKNALIQAIKTQDNEQLSSILRNAQFNIIQKTVSGIPSNYVIPFLKFIISKFKSNPKFGQTLIIWMKVVLIQHTSYLMTIPELVKLLAELYTTIDSRVNVLEDMLKLQGRMDLLLSQINNKRDKQTFEIENVPLSSYNENEEENSEDDNMDEEIEKEIKNRKNNKSHVDSDNMDEDSVDESNQTPKLLYVKNDDDSEEN